MPNNRRATKDGPTINASPVAASRTAAKVTRLLNCLDVAFDSASDFARLIIPLQ
jgi:hypothetical protein